MKRAPGFVRKKQIKKATLEIISNEGQGKLSTKNLALRAQLSEDVAFHPLYLKNDIIPLC
ncbi:hypothetical protein MNBD_BACTEROID07-1958 [hydrothermal vent metagenome]|uniref:Uncharacterized protein n=1 Tax=hydrothermal vent metagenome TaxID=652676 RepID=A0A3B0V0D3_9ZZZZ